MTSKHLAPPQRNFTRIAIVCVDLIKLVFKDVLRSQIKPKDLDNAIKACPEFKSGRQKLRPEQERLCCVTAPDYDTFDITLLYTLIRNLCSSLKPTLQWGKSPSPTAIQIGDDIERLRIFRNEVFGHCESSFVDRNEFTSRWTDLQNVIERMQKWISGRGFSVNYEEDLKDIGNLELSTDNLVGYKTQLEAAMYVLQNAKKQEDPEIWIQGEKTVICGGEACFKAEVESLSLSTSWSLTWQRIKGNTTEKIDISEEKYKGSNDRQLVIHEVSKEDEWEYQAVLSRQSRKRISNSLNLVATGDKPDFYTLKASIGVEGIVLNYNYEMTSNSPKVYHIVWVKDGQNVDIDHSKYVGGGIEDTTLTITSPTTEDAGLYTCTVTNAVGAVSKSLTLGIPSATISNEVPVYIDSKTTITSKVVACPPPEKAIWLKSPDAVIFEDININDPRYAGSEQNPSNPVLVIAKASFDDKLYYRLLVWNKIGECISNTVHLNVTGSIPSVTISNEVPVYIDSKTTITSKVVACPPPEKAIWLKSPDAVIFEDININDPRYAGSEQNPSNPVLVIAKASFDDKLYYRLLVWNKIGECISNTVHLNVTGIPTERSKCQPGPQYKEVAASENDVRIILLGKMGAGKSTSGNGILGERYFIVNNSWASVTNECCFAYTTRNGKRYQLYDTPIIRRIKENKVLREEIKRCLFFAAPGFHVLAHVISCAERLVAQDREAIKKLDELLGESACRYMIIIFTRIESEHQLLQMISESPEISDLIANCNGRYVWFGNDENKIPRESIDKFYKLVQKVILNNAKKGNVHYQHMLFEKAQGFLAKHAKTLQQQDANMSEEEAIDRAREISIYGQSPYDKELMKETEKSCLWSCIII